MRIAGINKNSFVDMKGMIAYVVFTEGCNLNCWYCHNRHIIQGNIELLDKEDVLEDIKSRKGFIDIVVISGGEPTINDGLYDFITRIKGMGIKVKLDTNGTKPEVINRLLEDNLLDYIAMDIKAPLSKYSKVVCSEIDVNIINDSIKLIVDSDIDYEFRTTYSPELTLEDIVEIARSIEGAKLYVIQQFNKHNNMTKKTIGPHSAEYVKRTAIEAEKYVKVVVKGLGVD